MIQQIIKENDFKSLQKEVFRRLHLIYKGDDLVTELGALLNLQKAAVYKRMSGDTMIKFNELVDIAVHFNFSLESIFNGNKQHISFQFDLLDKNLETYPDVFEYLKSVFDDFKNLPNNTLIYNSKHLPFAHYLRYPILFELHMYMWRRTSFTLESPRYSESKIKKLNQSELSILKYLSDEYQEHPIIEIWGPRILDDMYSKVKFAIISNVINDRLYLDEICSNIKLLINNLQQISKNGYKSTPGKEDKTSIQIYINELELGTPILYYESVEETKCFLVHQEPNFVYTYQKSFCQYSKRLLENIISYSKQISQGGSGDRIKFFNAVKSRFDKFEEDIYKIYEYAQLES